MIKMGKIQDSLMQIQSELVAPKNQVNNFGKYKYRSCEDILAAVKTLLKKTGTILTLTDEIVPIGNRFYIKATATLTGEGTICVSAFAREGETKKGMDESQITGAASSYARKYALNGLFCIDDTKDMDALNKGDEEEPQKAVGKLVCENKNCNLVISEKVANFSKERYDGHMLCMPCQQKYKDKMAQMEEPAEGFEEIL